MRQNYEGRINDLKTTLETITEQRDLFQDIVLRRAGLIEEKQVEQSEISIPLNRKRETPGQIAARVQADLNRKYWERKRQEAEANGELSVIGRTTEGED